MKPPINLSFVLILLLVSGRVSAPQTVRDTDDVPHGSPVSIVTLLSQADSQKTKRVQVAGFLVLDFEGEGLYLHKEDYEDGLFMNSIYLALSPEQKGQYKALDKTYVWVEASFHGRRDTEEIFSGELFNVREIRSLNVHHKVPGESPPNQ